MNKLDIFLTMAGVYLVVTSLAVVVGRLNGWRWAYDWGDGVGMAYTTAVNFFAVGVAFLFVARKRKKG